MDKLDDRYATLELVKSMLITLKAIEKTICEQGYSKQLYDNLEVIRHTFDEATGEAYLKDLFDRQ